MEGKDHPTTAFTTMTVQLISNTLPSREGQADMGPPVARKARDEEAGAPGTTPGRTAKSQVSVCPAQLRGLKFNPSSPQSRLHAGQEIH